MTSCWPARKEATVVISEDQMFRQTPMSGDGSTSAHSRDATIHELFEQRVAKSPSATAAEFSDARLTYHELNLRADALAVQLRGAGVTADTLVGLFVERSLEMLIGVLGILKAGGAYLPLDPKLPQGRMADMMADAQAPIIVTQQSMMGKFPDHRCVIVSMETLQESQLSHLPPAQPTAADNLAYVICTSGSTGKPKGVQITHRSVVNFLRSMQQTPGFGPRDVILAVTTLSFDIAVLEMLLPLTAGGKVVIAPRDVTWDGLRLGQMIADCGATVMQATPATWKMLIESGWHGDRRLKVLCGGEALSSSLAAELLARSGELWNMYGPTETTVWSTLERIFSNQSVTIGRPIANTQVYVLNGSLEQVPVGVEGELFIGGAGVARGYLNQPELTRAKFISNPFEAGDSARLYRTGDVGRFRPDGKLELLGRMDRQVKLRGFRIELGEIEAALLQVPGVGQAVVMADEADEEVTRLVAYLVLRGERGLEAGPWQERAATVDPGTLRAALGLTLPGYMIPSEWVFVKALPLTPNNKIDRKALGQCERVAGMEKWEVQPRGAVEARLTQIFASVLKVSSVGRTESFFDLGGHSILAATLCYEIERTFGQRLALATLLRHPTVEQLATQLDSHQDRTSAWSSLVAMQPEGSQPRFFCVHGAGGNILLYRDLARHLGSDYPFFGLQSQGLDGQSPKLSTVQAMAEKYVRDIRHLQPAGPYHLGGYCLGGTIAFEMARVLVREGQEVGLLALLDSYNDRQPAEKRPLAYIWQKVRFHLGNLLQLKLGQWTGYLAEKWRIAGDGELWSWLRVLRRENAEDLTVGRHSIEADVQEANDRAGAIYRPQMYQGEVTLFKPQVNYDFYTDPQMGWGDVVGGDLVVVELPVNPHAMLVEPFVKDLAARLKEAIDKQRSNGQAPQVKVCQNE